MIQSGRIEVSYDRQRKARKWCIAIALSFVVLMLAALVSTVAISRSRSGRHDDDDDEKNEPATYNNAASRTLEIACSKTAYPQLCFDELSQFPGVESVSPRQLVSIAAQKSLKRSKLAKLQAKKLSKEVDTAGGDSAFKVETMALDDCLEMTTIWEDNFNLSISQLNKLSLKELQPELYNVRVWMSMSLSYQSACNDGLDDPKWAKTTNKKTKQMKKAADSKRTKSMRKKLKSLSNLSIVAMELARSLSELGGDLSSWSSASPAPSPTSRRLLFTNLDEEGFPHWVDRKLLQNISPSPAMAPAVDSPTIPPIVADAVVSRNGDGDYSSIQMAVNKIPRTGLSAINRWTIYIKEGVYHENISLSSKHKYVTFIGDGIGKTIITGDRNVALLNYTTFRTATVAVMGQSFMAKRITFRNTAGPEGHQAVALRAGADFLIFDSCSFEGYQDTLYAHSGRHFYYNCDIYGTVDYIFGNAIAVFQHCRLYARKPMKGQSNTYTAQGRLLAEEPTGFSFQNCTISATSDLTTSPYTVDTYLARPWKAYSRTVFLHSLLDSIVHPKGWLAWNASNPFINTLYYGEYNNYGLGSNTALRIDWPGVHSNMSYDEASLFFVENFLASADSSWLTSSGIDFVESIP